MNHCSWTGMNRCSLRTRHDSHTGPLRGPETGQKVERHGHKCLSVNKDHVKVRGQNKAICNHFEDSFCCVRRIMWAEYKVQHWEDSEPLLDGQLLNFVIQGYNLRYNENIYIFLKSLFWMQINKVSVLSWSTTRNKDTTIIISVYK